MSLESKLNRILGAGSNPAPKKNIVPIDELISGEWEKDGDSKVFIRESVTNLDALTSSHFESLKSVSGITSDISDDRLLFMDTETTGLMGGTGTFAFMIGVGKVKNGKFQTTQFFMPNFSDEFLHLKLFSDYINKDTILATFNGKTFDAPLLESRFILNRMRNPLNLEHIDLLHYARVIWRETLDSCSLQSLEKNILNLHRFDDTPGFMIPQIYFNYIREGNAKPIPGIFEHNEIDIVSMHKIMYAIADIFDNPKSKYFESPKEILRVGKYHLNKERCEKAFEYFKEATLCEDLETSDKTHLEIGFYHKKGGDFVESFEAFSRVRSNPKMMITARVEMAKHLEHRVKDFDSALNHTNKAIQTHQNMKHLMGESVSCISAEELYHRQRRLLEKKKRFENK